MIAAFSARPPLTDLPFPISTTGQIPVASDVQIIHAPESSGAFMAGEVEKWGKVIRAAGIRLEMRGTAALSDEQVP